MTEPEKRGRDWMGAYLLVIETLFVFIGLTGVWMIYPPATFILGGALGVLGVEGLQARRERAARAAPRRLERVA